ncbi:alpha/beta fold hydrolase [Fictibacillus iocasae]|uniref:Alpha/beta fold hydrolase n=1 Tax=Fictibacillus iocasae TaxID=2715437 RepID=A0ABW2NTN0_9BACL
MQAEIHSHDFTPSCRVTVNGVNLHYELYENKADRNAETIILIHGFLSSTLSFRKLIPLLTEKYHVYALDLPGFGQSEKSRTFVYKLSNYGELIIDFMEKLAINQAILIGHSMGGQVSLHAAKHCPKKIKRLILLGCCGYVKRASRSVICCSYIPFFSWGMKTWVLRKNVKENLLAVLHDSKLVTKELIEGYRKPLTEEGFFHSLIRLLRQREGDMERKDLQSIQTPVLMIWGREDKVMPVKTGYRLQHDLPDAKLIVYDDCGHLLMEERPEDIVRETVSFINGDQHVPYSEPS